MKFLKSTEEKIKTSTKETTNRLGFPSIEELSLPSVKMEEFYSFDKGIDAKESKANTEKAWRRQMVKGFPRRGARTWDELEQAPRSHAEQGCVRVRGPVHWLHSRA